MRKVVVLASVMVFILASYLNAQEGWLLKTLKGHTNFVRSVAFSPDGKYIASAGGTGDKTIKLWSIETGECIKTLVGHTDAVASVSFSPDGKYIASGGRDKTIKLWSVETGECIRILKGHTDYVNSVSFSPDGKYIASGGGDKRIKLWSVETGGCINTFKGHRKPVGPVSFSPDGKHITSGSDDKTLKLWSVETGECIKTLKGHTSYVCSVSFSPDGKYIASGSWDDTIKLWSVETGECIKTLKGHTSYVCSVSFSPDGKYIASGSKDKTIKLWSVETGECIRILKGHTDYVNSVSFSPDGKYIVSGSGDKTIKLWANIFMYKFRYISSTDTKLKSPTGKVLTKLPMGTKVEVETREKEYLYVKVSEKLKGWVKRDDVSFEKPDMMKPVVRIMEKSFKEPDLYLKGVAYDDKKIVGVKFGDLELGRASFEVEKGNYEDVYPFEAKITLTPAMKLVLKVQDRSGKITKVPVNIEEPVIDYTPKYVQLEVKEKTPVRKEPSTKSEVLTKVSEKTVLVAIGHKDDWYYLEGGGWIYSGVVKEKKAGIKEVVSKPVEVKAPIVLGSDNLFDAKQERKIEKATTKSEPKKEPKIITTIDVSKADVRSEPGINYDIVTQFYKGQEIGVFERKGKWLLIGWGEKWLESGWIHMKLFSPITLSKLLKQEGFLPPLGCTEKEVLSKYGSPADVANFKGEKVYGYGRLYGSGTRTYGGKTIHFQYGVCTGYRRVFSGDWNKSDSYSFLADVAPAELFGTKYKYSEEDLGDLQYQKVIRFSSSSNEWIIQAFAWPIREYDPQKGYYWRNPSLKEYKVLAVTQGVSGF